MNMPAHPPHADNEPAKTGSRRNVIIIAAVGIIVLLASIHLLRTVLG